MRGNDPALDKKIIAFTPNPTLQLKHRVLHSFQWDPPLTFLTVADSSGVLVTAVHVMLTITYFIDTKCNTVNYRTRCQTLGPVTWIMLHSPACFCHSVKFGVNVASVTCYLLNTFNKTISVVYKSEFWTNQALFSTWWFQCSQKCAAGNDHISVPFRYKNLSRSLCNMADWSEVCFLASP